MRFNPETATPREVEAHLRKMVLRYFGNVVEDGATISAANGYYDLSLDVGDQFYSFQNFRKSQVAQVLKALRALK